MSIFTPSSYPTGDHPRFWSPATDGFWGRMTAAQQNSYINTINNWNALAGGFNNTRYYMSVAAFVGTQNPVYLQKIKDIYSYWNSFTNAVYGQGPIGNNLSPSDHGDSAVIAAWTYDTLYPFLNAADREYFLLFAMDAAIRNQRIYIEENYSPFNSSTFNRGKYGALAAACLLYPEAASYWPRPVTAANYGTGATSLMDLWEFGWHTFNEQMQAFRVSAEGGCYAEGWTYYKEGPAQIFFHVPVMVDRIFGTNFAVTESHLTGHLRSLLYLTEPDGTPNTYGDQNSNFFDFTPVTFSSVPLIKEIAFYYEDPYLEGWLRQRAAPSNGVLSTSVFPSPPWGPLQIRPLRALPSPIDLPLYADYKGAGVYFMQDAWAGEDTKQITVSCGGVKASHQRMNDGHFEIFNRGTLCGHQGAYAGGFSAEHYTQVAMAAIGNNCLLIKDPADQSPLSTYPRNGRYFIGEVNISVENGRTPLINDGGQRRVGSPWNSLPRSYGEYVSQSLPGRRFDGAKVPLTIHEPTYDYIECDLTNSYNAYTGDFSEEPEDTRTTRVNSYKRKFLYYRPNLLIVLDEVDLIDPTFEITWLLHTREEPLRMSDSMWRLTRTSLVESTESWNNASTYIIPGQPSSIPVNSPTGLTYPLKQMYQYGGTGYLKMITGNFFSGEFTGPNMWSHWEGSPYTGFQTDQYSKTVNGVRAGRVSQVFPGVPDWHPKDPTKGPIEACGYQIQHRFGGAQNNENFRRFCHIISLDEEPPSVTPVTLEDSFELWFTTLDKKAIFESNTARLEDFQFDVIFKEVEPVDLTSSVSSITIFTPQALNLDTIEVTSSISLPQLSYEQSIEVSSKSIDSIVSVISFINPLVMSGIDILSSVSAPAITLDSFLTVGSIELESEVNQISLSYAQSLSLSGVDMLSDISTTSTAQAIALLPDSFTGVFDISSVEFEVQTDVDLPVSSIDIISTVSDIDDYIQTINLSIQETNITGNVGGINFFVFTQIDNLNLDTTELVSSFGGIDSTITKAFSYNGIGMDPDIVTQYGPRKV